LILVSILVLIIEVLASALERKFDDMNPNRELRAIVALAILLCIVGSLTGARSEDKSAGGLRVATVDVGRVQNEYKVISNFKKEFDNKQQVLKIQLQTWQQNALLSETDQKMLADLTVKDKTAPGSLSAAEKTNQTKLLDQSRKLMDDYNRLQGTPVGAITDADKQKLQSYLTLANGTQARSDAAQQALQSEIQTKVADTAAQAQKNLQTALKTICKEKGYNLILNTEIAPFADNDCTDEVIKVLNK
jgi:Skp family chaperone for outer membrane proteins